MENIAEVMYALGQIARVAYPDGALPQRMMDTLLSRPLSGLAMLNKANPLLGRQEDENYRRLIDRLPADLTDGPVPVADQGPFWTGWYHYAAAIGHAMQWGPGQLTRAGQLLYGERWQSDLARALGVNDRRVRAWMLGERNMSAGIWADIAALLRQRHQEGIALLRELDAGA
ncbi:hypothetical protein NG831_06475 [Xanthomonas sacchari]|uniref:hypothetical protein n=1 Tax=Xanthomonas sacchari TaxID=56458 RepID=UPI00225424D6|nr:hypothetical protein [Xanthomonas sacchari]MCW0413494.1 hypothetical protein [Xanthomonas sacchari]UYK67805.1 hypothetical protein NG831_06475 [Xanthomonas sacchari]